MGHLISWPMGKPLSRGFHLPTKIILRAILTSATLLPPGEQSPKPIAGRTVSSEHKRWTVHITPLSNDGRRGWGARVEVLPPTRHRNGEGVAVSFRESRSTQAGIVIAALDAARHYIDGAIATRP
jgi:hypothetical protein